MRPEAVQCRRCRQLSRLTQVHHAQPARHAQPTHRWLAMKRANRTALGTHWQGWAQGYLVLPRSPRHEPDPPPAQHIRRGYLEHRDELQAEAILCCNRDRIARLAWCRTHMPPPAAFQAQSSSCRLHICIPCVYHTELEACGLSSPHRSAGRGRSALSRE